MKKMSQTKGIVFAALFAALTAVGGYLAIPLPFTPVPITLQTLFVLLAGAMLGANLGALSQFIYVLVGVLGVPVFAKGSSGLGTLAGPSGGYLVGFIVAAYVIGKMVEKVKKPKFIQLFIPMVVGSLVIYLLGVAQLAVVAKLGVFKAIALGVVPFLIGDVLKIIAAALVTLKVDIKKYF